MTQDPHGYMSYPAADVNLNLLRLERVGTSSEAQYD